MLDLISELKYEHSQITATLRNVINVGINSEEGRNLLFTAKSHLLEHLKKEDVSLYPVLWEAAKNSNDLKDMLDLYANDMVAVSKMALEFFDKYESGGDALEFNKDYTKLFKILTNRIIKEETVIYKKYEELLS